MRLLPLLASSLLLLAVVVTRQQPAPPPATTQEAWAVALAQQLGNGRPSAELVAFLVAWQRAEGTGGAHNPLNTSQPMPGSTTFNSHGVQNYATAEDGLAATATTLRAGYPGYAEIVAGIQRNDPALALRGLAASPWGTNAALVTQLYQERSPVPANGKSVVTEAMTISTPYDSCGSDTVWASIGQWGGCHLGVDFAGPGGTPVYLPFDCIYEMTGYYDSPAIGGDYVICTITDAAGERYQYYSGHLRNAIRAEPGTMLGAGTFIGYTLAGFDHTHVQLCGPANTITERDMLGASGPIPCPTPGLYYKDFAAFYATH